MFKFVHAADIHLDSPLRGLERYEGAPVEQVRDATRAAFRNLMGLAVDEKAQFVLIAGDLYDGDWRDYNTGLFFAGQMSRLREAGIKVFIVAGNHDAASRISRDLRLPDNVHLFSTHKPESQVLDNIGVAIHGHGFAVLATTDNLAAEYPAAVPDCFNIGLLHTSVTGYAGHEPYAPCSLDDLLGKGYNYWALGHVHNRQVLSEAPWAVFSGSAQGRNIRETGAKGCTLVTVEDDGAVCVEHRDMDVLRWALLDADATGCDAPEEILELVRGRLASLLQECDGRMLACRVRISGRCRAHRELSAQPERWTNEIRQIATDESGGSAWIEKVQLRTATHIDLDELASRDDPIGGLVRSITQSASDAEQLASLAEELSPLRARLPAELREGEDALDLESPGAVRELLEAAQQLLIPRLLSRGEEL